MSPDIIIVDTCSYLRLAQSISPLLKQPFCGETFALVVIKELYEEYKRNQTLRSKFGWVDLPEYIENRQGCLPVKKNDRVEINNAFYFIREGIWRISVCS